MSFFKDERGKLSMMRLLSFLTVVGCVPLLYIHPEQTTEVCVLIGGALAGKWLQKKGEAK